MNVYEIESFLRRLGVREAKSETYPNTYSLVSGSSFLAQQVSNRDSASWKKAEYIVLTDSGISQGILNGWKHLTERDPLPSAIQKLCVPSADGDFDVYDARGTLIKHDALDKIITHIPDVIDALNEKKKSFETHVEITKNNGQYPSFSPSQVIYYGVPGSGKSNTIKNQLKSVPEFQKIRCVFHPEYTNADFVGQIKPTVENGKVEYKFTPGPFAKILRRAYLNPTIPFYLVIEEINRGNAAAIFGDVFQLCDRIKPGDDEDESGYGLGWSSYFTENADLSDYIRDIASLEADKLESHSDVVMQTHSYSEVKDSAGNPISLKATSYISLEIKRSDFEGENLRFSENTAIRLPPNLSILATMNTSDQNVFTLDNAFQRRFDMELVRNEFEKDDAGNFKNAKIKAQHDAVIEGTDCTWGDFWEKMNDKIVSLNRGLASTEDKRLGPWFVCSIAGGSDDAPCIIPAKTFAEKVLKYLWDDAFKFKRPQVFADGLSSLEQVVKKFEEASGGNLEKLKAVFKEF